MNSNLIFTIIILYTIKHSTSVRLHKLFQYLDGFKSEHNLLSFLHVGTDYAVVLKAPRAHDKYFIYHLYEVKNIPDIGNYRPRLLAISKVPVDYIKEQLKIYRNELYSAKYKDDNTVPGTRVKTLREWQLERALNSHGGTSLVLDRNPVLRTVI